MKKVFKKALAVLSAVAVFATSTSMTAFAEVSVKAAGDVTIQVLATSDLHGKFAPYDYALNAESKGGSMAQIATVVNRLRTENSNTLLIDVGDSIQGNSAEIFLDDETHAMAAAMNAMKYDVWVAGNHEFNYGVPALEKIMKEQKAKVLFGNVYKDDKNLADAYTIIEKNGVKIGIIGMVTPNITRWDGENLKGYKVTDPVEETKKVVAEIKDKTDVIIAAMHMSETSEYDVKNSGTIDLTKACPEIDLVIAAHEHKGVEGVEHNGVLTVENKSDGQTVAQINLSLSKKADGTYEIKDKKAALISVAAEEADAEFMKVMTPYDQQAKDNANKVIGKLKGGNLVGTDEIKGIPQSQIAESAMINLINEVQMYYTDAEVSAAAAFDPKANMYEGDIRNCDTALIYKYTNTLYKVEMTGAQLKKFMEWSACYYNTFKPGDVTVSFNSEIRGYNYDMFSGLTYDVNISKEPWNRIENVKKANGKALKDTEKIIVAVNNYRASSQLTSYGAIFKEGEKLPVILEKDVMGGSGVRELIGKYIKEVKNGVIEPQVSNNWKLTGTNWKASDHAAVAKLVNAGKLIIPISEDGRTPNVKSLTTDDIKGKVAIKLVASSKTLKKGKTVTFKVEAPGYSSSDIKWTSSKSTVAKVTAAKDKFSAKVKAVKPGKVKVTVKVAGKTKSVTVTVK